MEEMPLARFGMTNTEARIYLEILKLGETTIGPIIKRTGLHRGTVYNAIADLAKKGFLSYIDKEGIRYYKISGKKIFEHLADEKKKALEQEKSQIGKLFEEMKSELHQNANVNLLVGDKGFKAFFRELYEWAQKTKKEYFFMGRGNEMIDHFGVDYYTQTQKLKKKLKIKCRVILNDVSRKEPVGKIVRGDVRYLPMKYLSPTSTWIYDDKIVIVIWQANPIISIVISSKEVNESYRSFFELLWNTEGRK